MTDDPDPALQEMAEATLEAVLDADDGGPDDATFDAPWQARAFAMAVALCDAGGFEWTAFNERFVDRVEASDAEMRQSDVEGVYYREWMAALEELLEDEDVLSADELEARQAEFAAGDRDASEFVRTADLGRSE